MVYVKLTIAYCSGTLSGETELYPSSINQYLIIVSSFSDFHDFPVNRLEHCTESFVQ